LPENKVLKHKTRLRHNLRTK